MGGTQIMGNESMNNNGQDGVLLVDPIESDTKRTRIIGKVLGLSDDELNLVIAHVAELQSQGLPQSRRVECRPSA